MRKLALSDEILLSVQQPARYIGGEINMCVKDPIRTYLAGITNLGLAEVTRKKSRKSFMEQMKPKL